jgi:hypothetical protein
MSDPEGAIAAAQTLLSEGKIALSMQRAHERAQKKEMELMDAIQRETREEDWSRALKDITSEARRDRAIKRFKQFLDYQFPGKAEERLSTFKRDGFTLLEISGLRDLFQEWRGQPKHKKGKQGRRKSEYDGRLRTELVGLVPRKPRTRA